MVCPFEVSARGGVAARRCEESTHLGRHGRLPSEPLEELRILLVENRAKLREVLAVKPVQVLARPIAEHDVHLEPACNPRWRAHHTTRAVRHTKRISERRAAPSDEARAAPAPRCLLRYSSALRSLSSAANAFESALACWFARAKTASRGADIAVPIDAALFAADRASMPRSNIAKVRRPPPGLRFI